MTRSTASRRSLATLALLSVTLASSLAVLIWGLAGDGLRRPAGTFSGDATADARKYIVQRPFDPAGWLAWAGSTISSTEALPPFASKVVEATKLLGPVDPQVLRAQALLALRRQDIAGGLERAADIAALFPAERSEAFVTLKAYLRDPAWAPFLASRLSKGWPQVDAFVLATCTSNTPLADLIGLVQQIARTQPMSDEAVTCVGNRAIAENAVPAAYWIWLNASRAVPRSVGNVFNGDFELPFAGRLFDWRLAAGGEYREGFTTAIRNDDSRGQSTNVLAVRFNGRPLRLPIAQQFLALTPGRYVLTYSMRDHATAPSGVSWVMRCVPPLQSLTSSAPVTERGNGGWTIRKQEITIPAACTGQLLDLEVGNRLQMLQGLQGTVFFDDFSIIRQ